jgi:UDP:flavonoid glycosyltransferase YjiC (YdhE family)
VARVFFAWELGGDLGHARRVLAVARGLRALGHETAFAFRDLTALGASDASLEGFAAPWLAQPALPNASPLNASEILLNRGFGDGQGLAGALRAWRGLFDLWKPDLLVADFAPGALLAARAAGLKRIALGSGFSTPPARDPMPALRSWTAIEDGALRTLDTRLLAGVRDAFARLEKTEAAPASAAELFRADAELLCTWPEIDPFGPREADYVGPQDDAGDSTREAWRGERRPRILAYLKPRDPRFAAVVGAIGAVAGEAIVAAPGLPAPHAQSLSTATVRVHGGPVALAPLLAGADLCVCHSGPGTVAHALAAGVPLALLPQQLEQYLVGRRIVSSGCGVMVAPDAPAPEFDAWLAQALAQPSLRQAAAASPLAGRKAESAAAWIAARLAQ